MKYRSSFLRPTVRKLLIAISILLWCGSAQAFTTEASYYTVASCLAESEQCITASGERLNDEALTAASWDYAFGTRIRVTNLRNNREVILRINDRGPSRRLYHKGRTLDLSKKAFETLAPLSEGVINVKVEVIQCSQ